MSLTNRLNDLIGAKKGAEKKLQGLGKRIRKNVMQGQEDFQSGKIPHYGSINPLKK